LSEVREHVEQNGGEFDEEGRIPCRVLRASREIFYCPPTAWKGFCKRRTSWYWESGKTGQYLIVSNTPLDHLDLRNPILITESNFKPDHLPSPDEIAQLVKSQEYQKRKPRAWEDIEPEDEDFYRTWFERHPEKEPFDFDKIFVSHSANHANFLDPKFFIKLNDAMAPYSVADSLRVCSACLEFFNILGGQWKVKYVTPCIGAVMFARLPADRYLEVKMDEK